RSLPGAVCLCMPARLCGRLPSIIWVLRWLPTLYSCVSSEILSLPVRAGRFLSRHASPTVWTRTLDHWGFALGCCPIKVHVKRNTSPAARCREIFVSACKPDCVDAYPRSLGFCDGVLYYKSAWQEIYCPGVSFH